jgi:hypothetical protein
VEATKHKNSILEPSNKSVKYEWCVQNFDVNTRAFYVNGSVHRESMSIIAQQDANIYSLLYRVAQKERMFFK